MVELKKLSVYVRTGEPGLKEVNLEGDDLKVFTEGSDHTPLLKVKDSDDIIAVFQNWEYWEKCKEK